MSSAGVAPTPASAAAAAPGGGGGGGEKRKLPPSKNDPPPAKKPKKKLPRGAVRAPKDWCRPCVGRMAKNETHRCVHQTGAGIRCVDCAENNHTCEKIPFGAVAHLGRALYYRTEDGQESDEDGEKFWAAIAEAQRAIRAAPANQAAGPPRRSGAQAVSDEEQEALELRRRSVRALEGILRALEALEPLVHAAHVWAVNHEAEGDEEEDDEEEE